MSKTIIFLDFDGVLCDSVKEAYLLSRYAFYGFSPFEKIDNENFEKFIRFRPSITNSWQYYNFYTDKKEGYNNITQKFNEKFLSKRKELMTNYKDFWLSLETKTKFFDKVKPLIEKYPESFRILSTKNKEAILEKFSQWNINISPKNIYDKTDLLNISKGDFIKKLRVEKAILIDDSEENIESCKQFDNINAILTSWGYAQNSQNGKTEEMVIKMIKEELCI